METKFPKEFLAENIIDKPNFHVQFHITNRCNLHCSHCYEGEKHEIVDWDLDNFKYAIDALWKCFDKWGVSGEISLIGGEPTLHPHFFEMLDFLDSRKDIKYISILTNGVNLSNKLLERISQTNYYIQISIDGIDEYSHDKIRGKGNYKKSIATIAKLKEKGILASVHYVLSKQSTPLNEEFFNAMLENGIHRITFSRLVPFGNANKNDMLTKSEIRTTYEFLNSMKTRFREKGLQIGSTRPLWCNFGYDGVCPAGIQTITVLENGDLMPCRRLPIVIGNILKDNFFKIWYADKVLNDLRNRQNIHKCGSCEFLDKCGGGRCIAYAMYGDYMQEDPQCWKN